MRIVGAVRTRLRLSQREVAELTGLTQPAVARLERDAVSPTLRTLSSVLEPLGETPVIALLPNWYGLDQSAWAIGRYDILPPFAWRGFPPRERYARH